MATITTTIQPNITTTALWQSFLHMVHDAFITFGWSNSADTGQLNPSTATLPGTLGVLAGYEIFTPGDVLASTAPFYVKVQYGLTSGHYPYMAFQVASGTDGAGNLTGQVSTAQAYAMSNDSGATTRDSYFSGDSGRMTFCLFPMYFASNGRVFVTIERARNSDGSVNDSAVIMMQQIDAAASFYSVIPLDGRTKLEDARYIHNLPAATSSYASSIFVSAVYPILDALLPPMMGVVAHFSSSMTVLNQFTITLYGASHTYMSFAGKVTNGTSNTAHCVAMLWE